MYGKSHQNAKGKQQTTCGNYVLNMSNAGKLQGAVFRASLTVNSGNFVHQVNSDMHLQTVEIQMRRLLMSRLIRVFTVCLVNLFFNPIIKISNKQGRCPNLPDVRNYLTLPYILVKISR